MTWIKTKPSQIALLRPIRVRLKPHISLYLLKNKICFQQNLVHPSVPVHLGFNFDTLGFSSRTHHRLGQVAGMFLEGVFKGIPFSGLDLIRGQRLCRFQRRWRPWWSPAWSRAWRRHCSEGHLATREGQKQTVGLGLSGQEAHGRGREGRCWAEMRGSKTRLG